LKSVDPKEILDSVTFSFEATGPKSQSLTLKNQQMMQLLQMTQDPNMHKNVMTELLKSMNLDPEEFFKQDAPAQDPNAAG